MFKQIVAIADLHAHPHAAFSHGNGADNDRLRRTLDVLRGSLATARSLGAPWVFAGDLVHTAGHVLNVVLSEIIRVFDEFPGVDKIAVWGNHDSRGVGGRVLYGQTVWPAIERAVENLHVLVDSSHVFQTVKVIGHGNADPPITFAGAGAQPTESLIGEPPRFTDIGVYHGVVRGTTGPNGYLFDYGFEPEDLFNRHRVTIVGDIHHPQKFMCGAGDARRAILIPGSPEHQNFSDVGEHGWWVVTITDDNIDMEMQPSPSPMFITVDTPDEIDDTDEINYYRVRTVPRGAVLPDNARMIAPAPTTVETRDVLRGLDPNEIVQAWLDTNPPTGDIPVDEYGKVGRALLAATDAVRLQPYRLHSIGLNNFCSYDEQYLAIDPGVRLVVGHGRDYPSNGAGKSTLFEAIYWALFGRTTKGMAADGVVRRGADMCSVEMIIDETRADGERLIVTRYKQRDGAHRLVIDGRDGPWDAPSVTAMTAELQRVLGITPELFQALAYFSQERLLLFSSATDAKRKEMLADLVGLAAYQNAAAEAGTAMNALDIELQRDDALLDAANARINSENQLLYSAQRNEADWENVRAQRRDAATADMAKFVATYDDARAVRLADALVRTTQRMAGRRADLEKRLAAINDVDDGVRDMATVRAELDVAHASARAAQDKYTAAAANVRTLEQQLGIFQKQLRDDEIIFGQGKCPTCKRPIDAAHRAQCLAPSTTMVQRAESDVANAIATRDAAWKAQAAWDGAVNQLMAELESATAREQMEHFREQLKEIDREMADARLAAAIDVDGALGRDRDELQSRIDRINAETNPHTSAVEQTKQRLRDATLDSQRIAATMAGERRAIAVYDYWRAGFSRQGIQSLLMDEIAAVFNDVRGAVFPLLTQGVYDVQLSTQSQTKSGELRERTELIVYEHGNEVPYESLSGGQRRRVDLGVMLTLVMAVSEWMRVPGVLGLLVLDEVYGFLDSAGDEGLAAVLAEIQQRIPSVFTVTQDPQLQALFDDVITVVQNVDGVSHIERE